MKHIKLFEAFISEKLSKSELSKIEDYLYDLDMSDLRDLCDDFGVEDEVYQEEAGDYDRDDLVGFAVDYANDTNVTLKDIKSIF